MEELPKGKYYVTVPGGQKLEQELEQLEGKREMLAGNIRTAKAYGDLSENFEYHEAKREQGFVEGRIQQLKIIVPNLHVVKPENVPADRVSFGTLVTVRDEDDEEWDFTIVGALEADPMEDRISFESPLGAALLGKRPGDVVEAAVPAGTIKYEVLRLRPYEF